MRETCMAIIVNLCGTGVFRRSCVSHCITRPVLCIFFNESCLGDYPVGFFAFSARDICLREHTYRPRIIDIACTFSHKICLYPRQVDSDRSANPGYLIPTLTHRSCNFLTSLSICQWPSRLYSDRVLIKVKYFGDLPYTTTTQYALI